MDAVNTFETPGTYRALRAEYGLMAAAAGYMLWRKRQRVRWPVAAGLFLYNDLVGYVPGAIAYRRSDDGRVPRRYYAAYNTAHSVLTAGAVASIWAKVRGPEWALLAIPLHIGVDRGLFGNFLKPFSVSFEPRPHPVWQQVREQLAAPWDGEGESVAAPVAAAGG
ncbi:MAG TPA: hypothetical protein VFF79_17240 [Conexibacter sp.]|jgi:hypothetical protein|nr:hypothetical protein [Conexibacter sp.]